MQIALNSDEEYDGGRLVFATSEGFVVPERRAGSATIHTCALAHGVTALTRGVRYGLFLSDTRGSSLAGVPLSAAAAAAVPAVGGTEVCVFDSLKSLLADATQMFNFYERSLKLLDSSSDETLCVALEEYGRLLSTSPAFSLSAENLKGLTPTLELLHHVHSLHPSVYPKLSLPPVSVSVTAGQAQGQGEGKDKGGESFDLVRLSRRHSKFMRQMLEFRDCHSNDGSAAVGLESLLCAALREYCLFLESLRGERERAGTYARPVPSLLVDHLWHTHMSSPLRYSSDCLRICGHRVDHQVEESVAEE
jgi:hypothetical protein